MKTKTINLYQFQELSAEQQAQVIENYQYINDDDLELFADDEICMGEIWESGFINAQPCYDLSYCQGSGACFDCNEFDFDKLLKDWKHPHKNWIINIIKSYCDYGIRKNYFGYHYSHSNTRDFYIEYCSPLGYDFHKRIIQAIYLVEKHIEKLRYELSKNLTARLYEQLEWLRDDEQIKTTLIDNDYYFNSETLKIEC